MNILNLAYRHNKIRLEGMTSLFQPACVFLVTTLVYIALYSALQIDDTWRYTGSVAAGIFEWDASHILMQPATVVWHKFFGIGGDALLSQKIINTVSTALSFSIIFVLLRKLNVDLPFSILLVTIAVVSRYTLELGTSGHMKMTTAPWLAAALYHCVLWELALNDHARQLSDYKSHVMYAGIFMAIGTAFLINTVIVLPFLALSMWFVLARRKEKFSDILATGCLFSVAFLGVIVPIMVVDYMFAVGDPSLAGFSDFLFAKNDTWDKPILSLTNAIGQSLFTIANNFVWIDDILPILRAAVKGDLVFDAHYFALIARDAAYVAFTLLLLGATYVCGLRAWRRTGAPVLTPIAFTLGCLVFAFWWNFHEEDFYFQITLPTIVLLSCVRQVSIMRWAIALWAVMLVGNNVFQHAIPKANYPLRQYQQAIGTTFGEKDLFVHFDTWPGRQDLTQLKLTHIPHWPMDRKFLSVGEPAKVFQMTQERIDSVLGSGGRVIVFRILDEDDWDAPWSLLPRRGISKQVMTAFFTDRYGIVPIGELAQIKAWELKPR